MITSANVKTDVYGSVIDSAGSGSDHNFCGGLGHASEDETGLIYMRARWYDPAIGRFISEDSAMDGVNWYSYCAGNPVNLIDESGKSPVGVALAIGGIAVGCFSSDIFLGVFLASFSAIMAIVGLPFAIAGAVSGVECMYGPSVFALLGLIEGYGIAVEAASTVMAGKWVARGMIYLSGYTCIAMEAIGLICGGASVYYLMNEAMMAL